MYTLIMLHLRSNAYRFSPFSAILLSPRATRVSSSPYHSGTTFCFTSHDGNLGTLCEDERIMGLLPSVLDGYAWVLGALSGSVHEKADLSWQLSPFCLR
jgi:hypothetical protein